MTNNAENPFNRDLRAAERWLTTCDTLMAGLIKRFGACTLEPQPHRPAYEALIQAITYQQLNGKAAEAIFGRFLNLFSDQGFPHPAQLLETSDEIFRNAGLSRQKIGYIRDIAAKALDGTIPTAANELDGLDDESIIKRLSTAKGVGRWTVEMYLIFTLGRLNVLPVDDFGIRTGYARVYGGEMPTPSGLRNAGINWAPYRSIAAWYLWRAAGE